MTSLIISEENVSTLLEMRSPEEAGTTEVKPNSSDLSFNSSAPLRTDTPITRQAGRFPSADTAKLLRQCPRCMKTEDPTLAECGHCGLRFFNSVEVQSQDSRDAYVGLGTVAFVLACIIGALIRYF